MHLSYNKKLTTGLFRDTVFKATIFCSLTWIMFLLCHKKTNNIIRNCRNDKILKLHYQLFVCSKNC